MYLPLALWRRISPNKGTDYLLNVGHPEGGSKARFFEGFGFVAENADFLIAALFDHPIRNEVDEVISSPYGQKYVVRCSMESPDGRNPCVVSVWVAEEGLGPRLVTAYPG